VRRCVVRRFAALDLAIGSTGRLATEASRGICNGSQPRAASEDLGGGEFNERYGARHGTVTHGRVDYLDRELPKNGDVPKSPLSENGSLMPSAGTISSVKSTFYRSYRRRWGGGVHCQHLRGVAL
jgi:hypothetical protein